MVSERLHVLERLPEGRPLLARGASDQRVGPLFVTYGRFALVCGLCSFALVVGAPDAGMLRDIVLQCPLCGSYNETWEAASPGRDRWLSRTWGVASR